MKNAKCKSDISYLTGVRPKPTPTPKAFGEQPDIVNHPVYCSFKLERTNRAVDKEAMTSLSRAEADSENTTFPLL